MFSTKMKELPEPWARSVAIRMLMVFVKLYFMLLYPPLYPCGGGVEYLHRDPASSKRRRNWAKKGRAIA
jgi:hypothetical protein